MTATDTAAKLSVPRLLNRELSTLDFYGRVLELAADSEIPLLERVKFCAIFSSNLDEFFSVRVSGLLEQAASGITVRSPDGRTPQQALADIRERVLSMSAESRRAFGNASSCPPSPRRASRSAGSPISPTRRRPSSRSDSSARSTRC